MPVPLKKRDSDVTLQLNHRKVEDLHRGTVVPFAHGKQMPMEDLHRMGAGGSVEPGHGAGPSAASVSNMDTLAAIKAPEAAAKAISGGKLGTLK
eukprot:symbB.v1.2.021131.t1/scaffold1809.1/size100517/6